MSRSTGLSERLYLRLTKGDAMAADALRARVQGGLLKLMMATYIPLMMAVGVLFLTRPHTVDTLVQSDHLLSIESYAVRYVNAYLKNPSDRTAIKEFYNGEVPASAVPVGGRALRASSVMPGAVTDGFQTWSVVVDGEIPKASGSTVMVPLSMQVSISIDRNNLFRAFTLPATRPGRPVGAPVELATQTVVAAEWPVYKTVSGFLDAMLVIHSQPVDLSPFIAAGSMLRPLNPARFVAMQVVSVRTNSDLANTQNVPPKADGIEVIARVQLQTASGVVLPMDYPLLMSVAAGRWQVDQINDNPSIVPPSESDSSVPSQTESAPATANPSTSSEGR